MQGLSRPTDVDVQPVLAPLKSESRDLHRVRAALNFVVIRRAAGALRRRPEMKLLPSKSAATRGRFATRSTGPTSEAQRQKWLSQQSLQHLARLAAATVPCAAAARRELGRQLSRLEDDIVARAMERGAIRAQALGLARRLTGSNRVARDSLLVHGEMDRARADIDGVVESLLFGPANGVPTGDARHSDPRRDEPPLGFVTGPEVRRLTWKAAYGCGEPTIDDQHHDLFRLGNYLIDTSLAQRPSKFRVASAVGRLLEHVERHFADEEAWLATRRYAKLQAHRAAHASLLFRAAQLRAKIDLSSPEIGVLIAFLADEVVTKHMLAADRDYFALVARDRSASAAGRVPL